MDCLACDTKVFDTEVVQCVLCKGCYHHNCVGITTACYQKNLSELRKSWRCPPCTESVSRRRRNDNTPVRNHHAELAPPAPPAQAPVDANMSCEEIPHDQDSSSATAFTAQMDRPDAAQIQGTKLVGNMPLEQFTLLLDARLRGFLTPMMEELKTSLSDEINSTLVSIKAEFSKELECIKNKIVALENENTNLHQELALIKVHSGDNDLKATIKQLRVELNDREQISLLNDVEITNVPECDGESVGHIVLAVATKLGLQLDERDVVSAHRVGPRRPPAAAPSAAADIAPIASRPRPIVLRLARRSVRDQLVNNARVRRGTTTADIGLPPHAPKTIYVNERLTKENRSIFAKARENARSKNWRFVWTKEGRVYVRKEHKEKAHWLRTEEDVQQVFC